MQPCIRFANIDDLSSLLDIEELSFSQHEYYLLNKKNYMHYFKKSNSDIRICELNKKPIGSSILFYRKNVTFVRLYSIAVIPQYQNMGIGKLLLEDAENISQTRGLTEIRQENEDFFVIEINDNPNIDYGVEDLVYGDDIYRNIINHLISKIEE